MEVKEQKSKRLSPDEAFVRLASYCASAERAPQELRQRMQRWELDEDLQEAILDRLSREGFLSEERYARAFVHDKHRFNGWGPRRLQYELRRKGIAPEEITAALEQLAAEAEEAEEEGEESRLVQLLRAKKRSIPQGLERRKVYDRLMRFGLYRGYDSYEVSEVVRSLLGEVEED